MLRALLVLLAVLLPFAASGQSLLQSATDEPAPEITEPLTPETIREMVARLSDKEVRDMLLKQLDATAETAAGDPADDVAAGLESLGLVAWEGLRNSVLLAIRQLPTIPEGVVQGLSTFWEFRGFSGTIHLLGIGFLAIGLGLAGEYLLRRMFNRVRERLENAKPDRLGPTLWLLAQRLILELGQIAVFLGICWVVIHNLHPKVHLSDQILWFFVTVPVMFARLMAASTRFILAPHNAAVRLVNTDDETAQFLHRGLIIAALILGMTGYILLFLGGHGAPVTDMRIAFWLNMVLFGWIFYVIWKSRDGLKLMLRGRAEDVTPAEEWIANAFPTFALILTVSFWILSEILAGQARWGILDGRVRQSLLLFVLTPALDTMVRGLVRHVMPPMTGEGELAKKAWEKTRKSYIRIGRVLVLSFVVIMIARIWDLNYFSVASTSFGARFAARLIEVGGILVTGYMAWELVTLWINRKLAREQTAAGIDLTAEEPGGGEGGGIGGSRLATVLPLISLFLQVTVIIFTVLIALGNLGIDVTPLLAGAGIVGLAIGFGAQKLVADVVSGIFFLIDDAFRTGEYVEVDGTRGTVEKISIRSIQLRHHRGPVHTIPFGEIPKLTNYSRDWVIMKLSFTLPYETDVEKVRKIFKQIGREMMEIPEMAQDFLQPFKSQGVFAVDDVGIVIRGKFMAVPGRQFTLRKEIYRRVQEAFDANDIDFARKEVRVKIHSEEETPDTPQKDREAAAGAAALTGQPDAPATA
ncbi:MAG: mechanosensitive ion channel family protein [Pseudomonadota bacterium]